MSDGVRRVIVVGAGSGIGAATAAHFHDRGDYVLAVDLRPNQTPAQEHRRCDLRDAAAITRLIDEIGPGWDVLAHVAGIPDTAPASDVLKVNYLGARLMAEGMLPLMRRGGSITAVASTAGMAWRQRVEAITGLLEATDAGAVEAWLAGQDLSYSPYATSKEALIAYAKALSGPAFAKYGVRVNTVSPGPVHTPILGDFEQTMGKETLDAVRDCVGRHAEVADIVPVIAFLASPQSGWVNGQDIEVDGGFTSLLTPGPAIRFTD